MEPIQDDIETIRGLLSTKAFSFDDPTRTDGLAALDRLVAERDRLSIAYFESRTVRDRLHEENELVRAERNRLRAERDRLMDELNNEFVLRLNNQALKVADLEAERDRLIQALSQIAFHYDGVEGALSIAREALTKTTEEQG